MFPKDILHWLRARGITDDAIEQFGLWWNGQEIVIPIKDENGKKLFNKYRRSPNSTDGPKYKYDSGSTATLFNYHADADGVIITEGEFDCILLTILGYNATSSTGGSGSFKKEWAELFRGKQVYICYDTDEAGVNGAVRVAWILHGITSTTRLITFPSYFPNKDVSGYMQHHNKKEFDDLIKKSLELPMPESQEKVKDIADTLSKIIEVRKDHVAKDLKKEVIEEHCRILNTLREKLKIKKERAIIREDYESVKQVPVTSFLKFDGAGFGKCLWHDEKTPSLKYYEKSNDVYCFGCQKYADVISVIRQQQNLSFKEAVEFLKKYTI